MRRPRCAARRRTLCGVGVLVASLAVMGPRPLHAAGPSEDATALIVQADAAHDAGDLAQAADLYVRAYRAMSAEERGTMGEFVVEVALDDLRATWKKTSDPAHARTAAELLDDYQRDTGTALPDALAEHRRWIEEAGPTEEPDEVEPDPIPDDTFTSSTDADTTRDRGPSEREVIGPVLIGVGVAAAAGGAVMIALGAPLGENARESRDAAIADPRLMEASPEDQMAFVAAYADYVDAEKKRGTGLVAGGAVLLGVGIGVAAYGVVRLVQHRKATRSSARVRAIPGGFAF